MGKQETLETIWERFVKERAHLLRRLDRRSLPFFATGSEVTPAAIHPRIELVESLCLTWEDSKSK